MSDQEPTMTDDDHDPAPDEAPSADQATDDPSATGRPVGDPPAEAAGPLGPLEDTDRVRRGLLWAGIGLLALLAAVALFRVYTNASAAIARFVAPDFQPVFQATFNLAVLLFAVAGIGLLLRRLQATA